MDVSSASPSAAQQMLQSTVQASMQAVEQMMQQELALISAMSGAGGTSLASQAAPPPGVGTVLDVTA